MAYTIALGTFSKLENSTAQPTTTGWAEYSVNLKDGCDISNPEITLSVSWTTVSAYNYATMMGRYYFIVGKNMLRENLCVLQLKVDVLATYKSQIGSATLYVLRSAGDSNGDIIDRFYPTAGISYSSVEDNTFTSSGYNSGIYIVNCVGMTSSGGSTLWKFTPDQYRAMLYALYHKIDGFQVTDILDAVSKFLDGSPEKLVSSAMWMPPYNFTSTSKSFYAGTWDAEISANLITDPIYNFPLITMTLPKHPQAATRGSYLNLAPYTTYSLSIPMFGMINLDTTALKGSSSISLNINVDALSGQGRCRVHGGSVPLLADLTAQIGVAVPLQGQNAGTNIAGDILTTLGGIVTTWASGGTLTPAIAAGALANAGISSAYNALAGASFSTGSAGGALASAYGIRLDATFMHIADEDNTEHGRPLCAYRQISTLSGFNQVSEGYVAIPGPLPEQQQIKAILESGFFYE